MVKGERGQRPNRGFQNGQWINHGNLFFIHFCRKPIDGRLFGQDNNLNRVRWKVDRQLNGAVFRGMKLAKRLDDNSSQLKTYS